MFLRSEVTGFKNRLELNCDQLYKTIPPLHQNESGGGGALGKMVCRVVLDFKTRPRQTLIVKTGSDCYAVKRSATGMSVPSPRR